MSLAKEKDSASKERLAKLEKELAEAEDITSEELLKRIFDQLKVP